MELLMNTQKECQQLEVYGEYLKKIPELLKQLETVEKMYQKAVLEEAMLKDKPLVITVSSSMQNACTESKNNARFAPQTSVSNAHLSSNSKAR